MALFEIWVSECCSFWFHEGGGKGMGRGKVKGEKGWARERRSRHILSHTVVSVKVYKLRKIGKRGMIDEARLRFCVLPHHDYT